VGSCIAAPEPVFMPGGGGSLGWEPGVAPGVGPVSVGVGLGFDSCPQPSKHKTNAHE